MCTYTCAVCTGRSCPKTRTSAHLSWAARSPLASSHKGCHGAIRRATAFPPPPPPSPVSARLLRVDTCVRIHAPCTRGEAARRPGRARRCPGLPAPHRRRPSSESPVNTSKTGSPRSAPMRRVQDPASDPRHPHKRHLGVPTKGPCPVCPNRKCPGPRRQLAGWVGGAQSHQATHLCPDKALGVPQ